MKPLSLGISVLLPVFFREPSDGSVSDLTRALDSVLGQDYPAAFEIIVIDDGSASPIADLLAGTVYRSSSRIRWVRLPRNGGLVNALNFALGISKYEFVARIDADDCWRAGKIEKQMRLFTADPDLSIVGTGMALVHENGDPTVNLIRPGSWAGILRFMVEVGCPFPHGSIVARKSVFMLLGGYPHDPRFSHCEDFALWGLWLRFFKPAMVEELLYDHTVSANSVSAVYEEQQRRASGLVHRRFLDLGNSTGIPTALKDLAETLGLSVLETGKLCFLAWKYGPTITVPNQTVRHMQVLMPDRRILVCGPPSSLSARPFFDLLPEGSPAQKTLSEPVAVEIFC